MRTEKIKVLTAYGRNFYKVFNETFKQFIKKLNKNASIKKNNKNINYR